MAGWGGVAGEEFKMTTSKAIAELEKRHAWVLDKLERTGSHYLSAEASALEHGIDALAEKLLQERRARAARSAVLEMLNGRVDV